MRKSKFKDKKSELLELLRSRYKSEGLANAKSFRMPQWGSKDKATINFAAACVGEMEKSDPFISARCRMYMLTGLELPSAVLKDCSSRRGLKRRQQAEPALEALVPLKRKLDMDAAWKLHDRRG